MELYRLSRLFKRRKVQITNLTSGLTNERVTFCLRCLRFLFSNFVFYHRNHFAKKFINSYNFFLYIANLLHLIGQVTNFLILKSKVVETFDLLHRFTQSIRIGMLEKYVELYMPVCYVHTCLHAD